MLTVDDFLNSEEIKYLQDYKKPWGLQDSHPENPYNLEFLYYAIPKYEPYFYKYLLDKITDRIGKHFPDRIYFNCQYYGQDGTIHTDGNFTTALIYVSDYHPEWGGFTQVGEEISIPKTGRMICFDGMIPHKGYCFSRQTCPPRISLAFKLTPI